MKNKKISASLRRYHKNRKRNLKIRIAIVWLFILIGMGVSIYVVMYHLKYNKIMDNVISVEAIMCKDGKPSTNCSITDKERDGGTVLNLPIRPPVGEGDNKSPLVWGMEEFYYRFENDLKFRNYILNLSNKGVKRNNPGNLKYARQTHAWGKNGFATFPNIIIGFRALIKQIEVYQKKEITIRQFLNQYSPHSENDTEWLIKCMANELQVPENTNIKKINTILLAQYIVKQEYSIKY